MKRILIPLLLLFSCSLVQAAPLRIGVLLIEDSVPLHVARQEQLYAAAGVDVEIVPFLSALERDSALTAKAIDGAVSDPVGAILFDRGRGFLKITSLCLGLRPEEGAFAILAAPKSPIRSVAELKGVEIAVSNATIIDYVTERLLEQHGIPAGEVRTVEVKKMPIRMQMLLSGAVEAATLPEPLASIARARGAHLIVSDAESETSLSQTVLIFRSQVLAERKGEVAAFFRALDRAVQMLGANPESFRSLFVEKSRIPPFLAEEYAIPRYPRPQPFPKALYEPIIAWLQAKNLAGEITYEEMVAGDFLGE